MQQCENAFLELIKGYQNLVGLFLSKIVQLLLKILTIPWQI